MLGHHALGALALGEDVESATTYSLFAEPASYTLTLVAAGLDRTFPLAAATTTYTLTLNATAFGFAYAPLTADTTSYTLTLVNTPVTAGYKLTAATTAYTLTLVGADVYRDTINPLTATTTTYTLTLNDSFFSVIRSRKYMTSRVGLRDDRRIAA